MSETKICPYCGEEIMAVAKKCRYCGEWLDGRNDEPAKIACPVCGEEIDADATVCPFCHEPVEGSETKDNLAVNNSTQHVGEAKTNEPDATTVNENKDGVIKTYFFDVIAHHYADFKGTMSRKEYWMYNLICVFFLSFLCIVPICFGSFAFLLFSCVFGIILFLPSLSATIRRLRDVGEEWTVLFVSILPLVGQLILLFYLCGKGEKVTPTVKWTMFDTLFAVALVTICVVELLVCDFGVYRYRHYY